MTSRSIPNGTDFRFRTAPLPAAVTAAMTAGTAFQLTPPFTVPREVQLPKPAGRDERHLHAHVDAGHRDAGGDPLPFHSQGFLVRNREPNGTDRTAIHDIATIDIDSFEVRGTAPDSDGDGVPDDSDVCPFDPQTTRTVTASAATSTRVRAATTT